MKTIAALLLFVSPALAQTSLDVSIAIAIAEAEAAERPTIFTPPADDLPAGQQPTPMIGVAAVLHALQPQPDEVLVDYGCGFDARYLITACRLYGTKRAIGVEIDPAIAASARRYVAHAGLSDRIQIITGDATTTEVQADVGVAYLWPETLERLQPRIAKLKRFACYGFVVPGLDMQSSTASNGGTVYLWRQPVVQIPVTKTVRQIVRLPQGSWCQVCGRHCSNPMAHKLQQQIVGYETQTPAKQDAKPAGRWVTQKVCRNGRCSYVRTWVPN